MTAITAAAAAAAATLAPAVALKSATRGFKAGDCALRVEAYAVVVPSGERLVRCDQCLEEGARRCASCKSVSYCSRECQKAAWRQHHKMECRCLINHSPNVPSESGRLFLKLLARHLGDDPGGAVLRDSARFRRFCDLMSHAAEIRADTNRMTAFARLAQSVKVFTAGVIEPEALPDCDALLGMFGRMLINAFSVQDSSGRRVGTALCLSASVLDHSCQPNVHAYFHKGCLIVKCLAAADSFDQLRINYCSLMAAWSDRQAILREQFYFTCSCNLCQLDRETHGEPDELKCSSDDCDGVCLFADDSKVASTADATCNRCGSPPANLNANAVRSWRSRFLAASPSHSSPDACKALLSNRENPLHPLHRLSALASETVYADCLNRKDWTQALRIGESVLVPARQLHLASPSRQLSPWQHDTGLLHFELGKLAGYQMELRRALGHYERAKAILSVTLESDASARALLELQLARIKTEILALEHG